MHEGGGSAEELGDDSSGHFAGLVVPVVVGAEGCFGWGVVLEEVLDLAFEGAHGAHVWVPAGDVGDLFAFDTILLVSIGKASGAITLYVIRRGL